MVTAYEMGWAELDNGALLSAAEGGFDVLITKDQNLRFQQNLSGRKLSILVLPTTNWPRIQKYSSQVITAVDALTPGDLVQLSFA